MVESLLSKHGIIRRGYTYIGTTEAWSAFKEDLDKEIPLVKEHDVVVALASNYIIIVPQLC